MKPSAHDERFMRRALELARRGLGLVHPNPMVGAVVVKGGRIVGEGWHRAYGGPHAEVEALRAAGVRSKGATIYVSLEPCAHHGKTPPCADLLEAAGIWRVVAGCKDPNPLVSGKGFARLRKAGIRVDTGVLATDCEAMNRDFFHWVRTKTPYVVLKAAQSLDGKIATRTGESKWISGDEARRFAHGLRAGSDAVIVGVNTVLRDDPGLDARGVKKGRPALKVILDSSLRTPPRAKIFSSPGMVILATVKKPSPSVARRYRGKAEIMAVGGRRGRVDVAKLFGALGALGVVRALVEGGGEVTAEVLARGFAREACFIVAPILVGGRAAVGSVGGDGPAKLSSAVRFRRWTIRPLGPDLLVWGEF